MTPTAPATPSLTRREREVLVELCRPSLTPAAFMAHHRYLLVAWLLGCGQGSAGTTPLSDAATPMDGAPVADGSSDAASGDDAGDDTTVADAGPTTPIPDDAAATRKLVFLTSALYTADLGGLTGADAKCQAAASTAKVPGSYKAWIGDLVTSPPDRLTHSDVPYELVDGTLIASDWTELLAQGDAALAHPIDETELGGPATRQPVSDDCAPTAWTGDFHSGLAVGSSECAGWTIAVDDAGTSGDGGVAGASLGATNETTSNWRASCYTLRCSQLAPLYCFEQ
jgi:hypothetical protein